MPKNKEIEEIIKIISSVDALSVGRGSSLDDIDEIAWKHGFDSWKNVKNDLDRMIRIPMLYNKSVRYLSITFSISNYSSSFFLVFLFLSATATLVGLWSPSQRFIGFFYFIAGLSFVLVVLRFISKWRMDVFFEKNRISQKQRYEVVHAFVQMAIDKLKSIFEETGEEKNKYRIRLYRTDYENLRIVAEPGLLRDCYFATVI